MQIQPNLPNDVLWTIINKLVPADRADINLETLAACRLASHVLYSLATPLFFSSIQLVSASEVRGIERITIEKRAVELNQILTNNDVAASVRSLTLKCHKADFRDSTTGSIITEILHRLPHIQDFTLKSENGYRHESDDIGFYSIAKDLTSAIEELFISPNLTRLDLCSFSRFPLALINACPNLQHLSLTQIVVYHDESDDMDDTSILQVSHLDSLVVDQYSLGFLGMCIRSHMSFLCHFSQLKNIQVKYTDLVFMENRDIMLLASQTLTTLKIYNQFHLPVKLLEPAPYDLGHFPALNYFSITLPTYFADNRIVLRFLNQLLSISSSTSDIGTLEIIIPWHLGKHGHGKELLSPDAGWSTLDETLTSDTFPSLNQVVFVLNMAYHRRLEFEKNSIFACVDALFPMLRAWSKNNTERVLDIHFQFI